MESLFILPALILLFTTPHIEFNPHGEIISFSLNKISSVTEGKTTTYTISQKNTGDILQNLYLCINLSGPLCYFPNGSKDNFQLSVLPYGNMAKKIYGFKYKISGNAGLNEYKMASGFQIIVPTTNFDMDSDGLPDNWEMLYFGNLNYDAFDDTDNDSFSNLCEYFAGSNPADSNSIPEKQESSGDVKVSGRNLIVHNNKFNIKGIGYQPTPIGEYPWIYDIYSNPDIYNRDLPLIREMGCNVIRTWGKVTSSRFLDACWNNGENPIYVIMGFWITAKEQGGQRRDITDPSYRREIIEDFKNYVSQYKDHPAVLMWLVGGEVNYQCQSNGIDKKYWYTLLNELGFAAYQIEGNRYHPLTTDNGEISEIGNSLFKTDDEVLRGLDVWGATVYRGSTFGTLFNEYETKSKKPFWIAEFGCDAYNHQKGEIDETTQAEFVGKLWDEIKTNSYICIGGAVFEYSDEWWKNMEINNPFVHNPGPYERVDLPDGWSDEEYYGIFSLQDNGENPDILIPRKIYYTLMEKWKEFIKGDLNEDRTIDISDVILCLRMAVGLDQKDTNLADMNGDGEVDITDVILILRKAIGLDL